MKLVIVNKNEAGQRLDKLLAKYLSKAPKSFIYKMLRKKNITFNNKKATGNEKTVLHDEIRFFLSDETYDKFSGVPQKEFQADNDIPMPEILYEDEQVLFLNKPCGTLSQKAEKTDISINEQMLAYLLKKEEITPESLVTFRPSVCNRLDRNTSGLIASGKTLVALQTLSELFRDRTLHKYYLCPVLGQVVEQKKIEGFLVKDETNNKVEILKKSCDNAQPIQTEYIPVAQGKHCTLLKVLLITGRSHQIRAHLASIGHPLLGDMKYGGTKENRRLSAEYELTHQLLHSWHLQFPVMTGELFYLSEKAFTAPAPKKFREILRKEDIAFLGGRKR